MSGAAERPTLNAAALDTLVTEIQASAKYRHVCLDLIRRLGAKELGAKRSLKEAIKETKNTLHQIGGAFLDRPPHYANWHEQLTQAAQSPPVSSSPPLPLSLSLPLQSLKAVCVNIMDNHASTRERLPLLETFYAQTLARVAPVRSVLDVCCGLNPLALGWMPLAPDAAYYACDIYGDMMAFHNDFFALAGVTGHAQTWDAAHTPPTQSAHVALLLKALPPLEQTNKAAALRLLRSLQAEHILVSFPTRTLGGKNKQMGAHYEARFRALIADEPWHTERHEFANELCFLLSK